MAQDCAVRGEDSGFSGFIPGRSLNRYREVTALVCKTRKKEKGGSGNSASPWIVYPKIGATRST
jgi:hypothetical protein